MTSKPKLNEELEASPRSLAKRAHEKEEQWRKACGLTKLMNRKGNATAMKRRRTTSPKEPRGVAKYRLYRDRKLGKLGAASKVRRIDPVTGEERIAQ